METAYMKAVVFFHCEEHCVEMSANTSVKRTAETTSCHPSWEQVDPWGVKSPGPKAHKEHESFLLFRKSLPQWFIRVSDQFFLCLHPLTSGFCLVSDKKTPATVVTFPLQSRFPNQPGQSAAVQNHRKCFTCHPTPSCLPPEGLVQAHRG